MPGEERPGSGGSGDADPRSRVWITADRERRPWIRRTVIGGGLLVTVGLIALVWLQVHQPNPATAAGFRSAYTQVAATIDTHLGRIDTARRRGDQAAVAAEITRLATAFDRFETALETTDFGAQAEAASAARSNTLRVATDLRTLAAHPSTANANALTNDLQLWDQSTATLASSLGVALPTPPAASATP